jgi:sec-independent protein translocase protein TatA
MLVLGEIVGWEFLLVIGVIALLFGSSKIPQLARSIGQAKREFEHGVNGHDASEDEPVAGGDTTPDPDES